MTLVRVLGIRSAMSIQAATKALQWIPTVTLPGKPGVATFTYRQYMPPKLMRKASFTALPVIVSALVAHES